MKFDQDWAVPLLIVAAGVLAGLIAWLVTLPAHPDCHRVLAETAGRAHMALTCR
jgi:hypothetical protein